MRAGLVELSDLIIKKLDFFENSLQNFDSWTENGKIEQGGHNETESGFNLLSFRYRGVIVIESLKDKYLPWVMAIVAAWLADNNEDREKYDLEDPDIEIVKLNEKLIDIELTVDFVDEMYLSEADDGPIKWNGKSWTIDNYELFVAESADVKEESK